MKLPRLRRPSPSRPGETNYGIFDRFTFVHFGIGVLYGILRLHPAWVALLAIGWEALEDRLKVHVPSLFPHPTADTWKNSLGDTLAVFAGWALLAE